MNEQEQKRVCAVLNIYIKKEEHNTYFKHKDQLFAYARGMFREKMKELKNNGCEENGRTNAEQ